MAFRMVARSLATACLLAACGGDSFGPSDPSGSGPGGSGGNGAGGVPSGGGGPGAAGGSGAAGGAGGNGGDLAGKMTQALCEQIAECGKVQVVCSDAGPDAFTCSAWTEEVAYDACAADKAPWHAQLFSCVAPTPEQLELIDACVLGLDAQGCPTQAELDAYAESIELGRAGIEPGLPPAACNVLRDLAVACDAVRGCEEGGSGTSSGGQSTCSTNWQCFSGTYSVVCSGDSTGYWCDCAGAASGPAGGFSSPTCAPSKATVNQACGFAVP